MLDLLFNENHGVLSKQAFESPDNELVLPILSSLVVEDDDNFFSQSDTFVPNSSPTHQSETSSGIGSESPFSSTSGQFDPFDTYEQQAPLIRAAATFEFATPNTFIQELNTPSFEKRLNTLDMFSGVLVNQDPLICDHNYSSESAHYLTSPSSVSTLPVRSDPFSISNKRPHSAYETIDFDALSSKRHCTDSASSSNRDSGEFSYHSDTDSSPDHSVLLHTQQFETVVSMHHEHSTRTQTGAIRPPSHAQQRRREARRGRTASAARPTSLLPLTVNDAVGATDQSECDEVAEEATERPEFERTASGELIVTREERALLAKENCVLPTHAPLTRTEERALRTVRRKIRNKESARNSRRKKEQYVDGLEKRVETYSAENTELKRRINSVEKENRSLLQQLDRLKDAVANLTSGKNGKPRTVMMAVLLSFALFVVPFYSPASPISSAPAGGVLSSGGAGAAASSPKSAGRTLMDTSSALDWSNAHSSARRSAAEPISEARSANEHSPLDSVQPDLANEMTDDDLVAPTFQPISEVNVELDAKHLAFVDDEKEILLPVDAADLPVGRISEVEVDGERILIEVLADNKTVGYTPAEKRAAAAADLAKVQISEQTLGRARDL